MTQSEPSAAELRAPPAGDIYLIPLASTPVPDGVAGNIDDASAQYR